MSHGLRYLLWLLAKFLFSLRYRVHVDGLENVRGLKKALILPNHPAYTDPPLVLCSLWPTLKPRPMLMARIFHNPLLFWVPKALGALEVPNLQQHSTHAREQVQKVIETVIAGLRNGDNHILWPAGHVQSQCEESLGAIRSVAEILRNVPDANLVLVRTRGLWGSTFSYARTGSRPDLTRCLLKGIGALAANLVFFAPRRTVRITVQKLDRHTLPELTREKLNPFFEAWYNAPGPEPPTYVPYHAIFGARDFEFPPPSSVAGVDVNQVKPEIKSVMCQMLAEKLGRKLTDGEYKAETKLDSLGLDSLDCMELSLAIEQRFGFTNDQVSMTIGDLWALAQGLTVNAPPKPPPVKWFKPPTGKDDVSILGGNIPTAFIRRALANRRDVAAADDLTGAVTYERFLVGAQAMANRFRKIDSPNIGILLPASVAADLVFMALQLAGKLPVLMNWTTGPANLTHAAKVVGVTHVITSRKFVDRTAVHIEGTEYIFLENIRAGISRLELLWRLLQTRFAPGTILGRVRDLPSDAPAVVLFTSGSEKAPKAVPLTHQNILSNLQGMIDRYNLSRWDSVLGFIPIFHSFGLTLTSLMPILGGCRVVHHPDPMDVSALVRKTATYKPAILCGTPTFVGYILDRAQRNDLASLRLVIVGAEKCPASLFERFGVMAPLARVIEGYGITECAPVVSCNRPEHIEPGSVGPPLPGVDVTIVDPESFAPRPPNEVGMLLVSGPNVFPGYIGHEGPAPFHEHDGKRWYVTGDLARMDKEGCIYISGRLKRFLKAGGEMISLPALEEPFTQRFPPTPDGPRVAVEGVETDTGRRIVLYTTEAITLSGANAILFEQGLRGIMRLDEVRRVDQIPVLGTGKTDYKLLRDWITSLPTRA